MGAGGFIGSRLAAGLTRNGVPAVRFTRDRPAASDGRPATAMPAAGVVFHVAGSITPALAEQKPALGARDVHEFSELLAALARMPDPPTVVLAGSGGTVYDRSLAPPYREDSPTRVTSVYAGVKLALEDELRRYAGTVPGVVLRLANVYGPGQPTGRDQGVLAAWLRAATADEPMSLAGDPESSRDYVYVDDVVDCMLRFTGERPGGEPPVLNVGSGEPTTLGELAELTRRVVGSPLATRRLPGRSVDRPHVWLDIRKVAETVGWRPRTPLPDGIAAMWRHMGGRTNRTRPALEPPA